MLYQTKCRMFYLNDQIGVDIEELWFVICGNGGVQVEPLTAIEPNKGLEFLPKGGRKCVEFR